MASTWTRAHSAGLVIITILLLVVGLVATPSGDDGDTTGATWVWIVVLILLVAFLVVAGQGVTGRWAGFLIDSRNKMSLSRLQIVLWTLVVLSAYLTLVLARIASQGVDALDVAIPAQLWWLMGISTTSLVGSPLLLGPKKQKQPDAGETERTVQLMAAQEGEAEDAVRQRQTSVGQVVVNKRPNDARLSDLFRGDETGNAAHLDIGKVQMLYFTLVLVIAYAITLGEAFPAMLGATASFPGLSDGMVALLGISHAGYLSYKAVPHSQAGDGSGKPPGDAPPKT